MRRSWFPPEVHIDTGVPLLGRLGIAGCLRLRRRSYAALRPPVPSARAPVPLASGLPRCGRSSVPAAGASADRAARRSIGKPGLRAVTRRFIAEDFGSSQVTCPSSSCVPPTGTPPGAPAPSPYRSPALLPSRTKTLSAPGDTSVSWLYSRGPLARLPTHRRRRLRRRRKAGYRPARLGVDRMGIAPTGRPAEFHGFISYLRSSQPGMAWSHLRELRGEDRIWRRPRPAAAPARAESSLDARARRGYTCAPRTRRERSPWRRSRSCRAST